MIAGEIEALLESGLEQDAYYDNLFGLGKGKRNRLTETEKAERRDKRKSFWSGLGNSLIGGNEEEGGNDTLANIAGLFRRQPAAPEDYTVNMGDSPDENKGIPNELMIFGGVVIAGGLVFLGIKYFNKKKYH